MRKLSHTRMLGRLGRVAVLCTTGMLTPAIAEPALDRVLSSVQVSNQAKCTALNIAFNLRVRYMSHFPLSRGQELRIQLRPIDAARAAAEILSRRESLRAPQTKFAHIRAIDFEAGSAAGPTLVLVFDEPVSFQVSQGEDFQSIVVKLFGPGPQPACQAHFQSLTAAEAWSASVSQERPAKPPAHGVGTASPAQQRDAAALMDEGRAALKKGDHAGAIAKFAKILKMPETDRSADALEMLGLARQKNAQAAEARAAYEDYLARYPSGEGADRVRQRLDAILTASGEGQPALKAPRQAGERGGRPETWTVSGSVSQFYIRDDSFRTLRDPSLPRNVNEDLDAHDTHQNELLSSLDAVATWSMPGFKGKLRFSGTEEHDFSGEDPEIVGVAALYADAAFRDWGLETRLGRQTRNTGGVLGRFDGAVVSFAAAQPFRLNAVAGSPVLRRRDEPFLEEKLFYGGSVDYTPMAGLDLTVFAIEQRAHDVLDRRAVGAEARYIDTDKAAFASIDYDIHYDELNAALVNGSWTLPDRSTLHAAYDYRLSPYLSTWNALQGQIYPTLFEMLKTRTLAEVEQLALDRTTSYTSVSGGFSRPLNDTFQVSIDATMTNLSGAPASGGVPETIGTGNEYFYSAQLIGNSVFTGDDLVIAGFRFADLDQSNYYVADLSIRYPLMEALKVTPRLMLGYRTGDHSDLVEYTVLPSVLFNYYVTRDLSLEMEVGAQWTETKQNGISENVTDLFFTVGYRYDFYADGQISTQARAAPYGAGGPK